MTARRTPRVVRAALLSVPNAWRDQVGDDVADDLATRRHGPWMAALHTTAVGLNLHWTFSRGNAMDDTRLALRRLSKHAAASLVSVLALACGIGAAAATWSLLSAVLLRPIPAAAPDRLAVVGTVDKNSRGIGITRNPTVYPMYPFLRDAGVFASVAAGGPWNVIVGEGEAATDAMVYFATPNVFETIGVRLAQGRPFTDAENRRGTGTLVAVLSDRFWRRHLAADPAAIGRTIVVRDKRVTVIGIAPAAFRGLDLAQPPDLYMPLETIADVGSDTTNYFADNSRQESPTAWVTVFGRLKPGVSMDQTLGRLNALAAPPFARRVPEYALTPLETASIPEAARAGMTQFTRLLGATVVLLLLIGCLTVGMLLLIRTEARRDEFAMCLALGATRARLARSVAAEGAILSVAGFALAIPLASWFLAAVRTFRLPGGVDLDLLDLSVDARTFGAAAAGAVAATLVIAFVAGVFGFSANVADVLRSRSGGTPRLTRRRTRAVLVVAQVAIAVVLLTGAGLFARSVAAALDVNPGFDSGHIVTGGVSLFPYGYSQERATQFFDDLRARLGADAAVPSLSLTAPQGGMSSAGTLTIDGVARHFPSAVIYTGIDDRYFQTMGIRVVRGRDFSADDRSSSPPVAIVSDSFGRMLANGGNPIGRRITASSHPIGQPPALIEVVGVAADVVTDVGVLEPLVMYRPTTQIRLFPSRLIVLRAADPTAAIREVMATVRQIDPRVRPEPMQTMDEQIGKQMGAQRLGSIVMGALGGIAALLTMLGVYVIAESMAVARTREMGIRAALGASRRALGGLVVAESGRLVGLGLAAGLLAGWLESDLIKSFLFRVTPFDGLTIAGVVAAIAVLAAVVSLRPALRAARVDLASVLREA